MSGDQIFNVVVVLSILALGLGPILFWAFDQIRERRERKRLAREAAKHFAKKSENVIELALRRKS